MKKVWMRHPNLTDREPREVPESAMRFHINAGWEQVPEGEEPNQPGDEPTEGEQADRSQEQSEERKGGTSRTSRRAKAEDKKEAES